MYVALETPSRPPPFMANAILNFHFDFPGTSLSYSYKTNKSTSVRLFSSLHWMIGFIMTFIMFYTVAVLL